MLVQIKGTLWIILDHFILMKEPKTSKSHRLAAADRSSGGIHDRVKWFYQAPVVRFYYNFVSIFLFCYSWLSNVKYRYFLRYLDLLRLVSGYIQLCSSCRLFSTKHLRRKSIWHSKFTDSSHRNCLAHLRCEFDYRWNLPGQSLFI